MKTYNILFLLLVTIGLLALSTPVYADNTTNQVQSVSPTANQLVEKFGNRIDDLLTTLANKAGVAADHFYPIFVFQQRITGIVNASLMILLAIPSVFLLRLGIKNAVIYNSTDYHEDTCKKAEPRMLFGLIVGGILTLICIIFTVNQIADTVGQIANPDYYAVQSLVHMVR